MSPDAAEDLGDTMWDAMVRHMRHEADAIERTNAELARRKT